MGLAFFASSPHANTCPRSSYKRHVGTLRNVSNEPGQCRICWIAPDAMREDAYALYAKPGQTMTETHQPALLTTPEKVVPGRQDVSGRTRLVVVTRTKVDGYRHAALIESPAELVSGYRSGSLGHRSREGRRSRSQQGCCVDGTGLVQRGGRYRCVVRPPGRIVGWVGSCHLHARVDRRDGHTAWWWRGRAVAPLGPRPTERGMVVLEAGWGW